MAEPDLFKTCPDCAEQVRAAASICRFCGHSFLGGPRVAITPVGDGMASPAPAGAPGVTGASTAPPNGFTPIDVSAYFDPATPIDPAVIGPDPDPGAPALSAAEEIAVERRRLESISPAPKTPTSPMTIALMALAVVLVASFCIFALVTAPSPAPAAAPTSTSQVVPTLDPQEISARYAAFADVATSSYAQISPLIDPSGKVADPAGLVIAVETSRYTLDSTEPTGCFSVLYSRLVSLDAVTLSDAQDYQKAADSGSDTSSAANSLVTDMASWSSFIKSDLPHNICTH